MKLARKIVLHAPVSDETLLDEFVERCLSDGVSLLAIVAPGCGRLEDIVDDLVVGDGGDPDRFLCTSSHPDEPLDYVLRMAEEWEAERGGKVQQVRF